MSEMLPIRVLPFFRRSLPTITLMIVSLFVFYLHPRCPRPRWICETLAYGDYSNAGLSLELPK